ncbi:hypothetical protein OEZ86_007761 [Tetradesmus obliquus]|nr:hypothetical protein OEZ86_007761 [Tetradesmus obliquus]
MVLQLALPTVVTSAAQQVIIITSQMFSGHIGTDELAAVALSNTWWNFCWYIILGVSTALDTLGSQAVGAGDKPALVVWTITSCFVLSLVTIPMSVSLWYGGEIARWFFGQGPAVAALVSSYSRWMIPGLWPMTMAALLQKYLQVQGLVGPPAITSGISMLINVAANWAGASLLGLPGVAAAATATRVLLLLSMVLAVALVEASSSSSSSSSLARWWRQPGAWGAVCSTVKAGFSWKVTWTFLALGIPGGLMLGLECASFEVTTAFAGYLGPAAVAAHAGVFSLTSLCYIALPFALATAATIRVGNLMGAGKASAAATSSRVVVALGTAFMAVCGGAIYCTRYKLGQLFTAGDPAVLSAVAAIAPLGAAYQVGDGILGTSQGVLRGLGRQGQLMLLNVACFWCVGVPAGWWLTFRAGWGLQGLWLGMASGCFLAAATSLVLMLLVDWGREQQAVEGAQQQVQGAQERGGEVEEGFPSSQLV